MSFPFAKTDRGETNTSSSNINNVKNATIGFTVTARRKKKNCDQAKKYTLSSRFFPRFTSPTSKLSPSREHPTPRREGHSCSLVGDSNEVKAPFATVFGDGNKVESVSYGDIILQQQRAVPENRTATSYNNTYGGGGGCVVGGGGGGGRDGSTGENSCQYMCPTQLQQAGARVFPVSARKKKRNNTHSFHYQSPALRRRLKQQEEIARENERIERRLKVIREADPQKGWARRVLEVGGGGRGGGGYRVGRRGPSHVPHSREHQRHREDGGGKKQQLGRGVLDRVPAAFVDESKRKSSLPARKGTEGNSRMLVDRNSSRVAGVVEPAPRNINALSNRSEGTGRKQVGILVEGVEGQDNQPFGWRDLYLKRQVLALTVETEATEVAGRREQLEALRAKTLWTEANARRYCCRVIRGSCGQSSGTQTVQSHRIRYVIKAYNSGIVWQEAHSLPPPSSPSGGI